MLRHASKEPTCQHGHSARGYRNRPPCHDEEARQLAADAAYARWSLHARARGPLRLRLGDITAIFTAFTPKCRPRCRYISISPKFTFATHIYASWASADALRHTPAGARAPGLRHDAAGHSQRLCCRRSAAKRERDFQAKAASMPLIFDEMITIITARRCRAPRRAH